MNDGRARRRTRNTSERALKSGRWRISRFSDCCHFKLHDDTVWLGTSIGGNVHNCREDPPYARRGVFVRDTTPASVKAIRSVRTVVPGLQKKPNFFWRYCAFEHFLHARSGFLCSLNFFCASEPQSTDRKDSPACLPPWAPCTNLDLGRAICPNLHPAVCQFWRNLVRTGI